MSARKAAPDGPGRSPADPEEVPDPEAVRNGLRMYLKQVHRHVGYPAREMDGETLLQALSCELGIPVIRTPAEKTWVWADLHLGDAEAWKLWNRPYPSVEAMDQALLGAWRRSVADDDTMICAGDVAGSTAWKDERIRTRLRACPGRRWLILGNHDVHHVQSLTRSGFEYMAAAAVYASNPPLVVTHVPLTTVPAGTVNVHGHIHRDRTRGRRENVSVEQTQWRPVRVDRLIEHIRKKRHQAPP